MNILTVIGLSVAIGLLESVMGAVLDYLYNEDWPYVLTTANGAIIVLLLCMLAIK